MRRLLSQVPVYALTAFTGMGLLLFADLFYLLIRDSNYKALVLGIALIAHDSPHVNMTENALRPVFTRALSDLKKAEADCVYTTLALGPANGAANGSSRSQPFWRITRSGRSISCLVASL
jgi:hypothetical protein